MKLDFGGVIKFPFEDRRWPAKLVIGTVLAILPLVNFLVMGYFMTIFQSGIRKEARVLPDWFSTGTDGLIKMFILGVAGTLCSLIYAIPIMGLVFFSVAISGAGEIFNTIGNVMMIVLYLLAMCVSVCIPFVIGAYLEREQIRDVLDAKRIWKNFRSCMGDALKLYALIVIVSLLSGFVNALLPVLALVVTTPLTVFVGIVAFRGFGEIYPVAAEVVSATDVASSVDEITSVENDSFDDLDAFDPQAE